MQHISQATTTTTTKTALTAQQHFVLDIVQVTMVPLWWRMVALWGSGLLLESNNDPYTISLKVHSIGAACTKTSWIKSSFHAFALPSTKTDLWGIQSRSSKDSKAILGQHVQISLPKLHSTQYLYTYRGVKDTISPVWLSSGPIYPMFSERKSMFNGIHIGRQKKLNFP